MYKNISVINEPRTFINKNLKIFQIIRPLIRRFNKDEKENPYECFNNLLKNVDIVACGVSYDGNMIHENYKDAILHCLYIVVEKLEQNTIYHNERTDMRFFKLLDRDWFDIKDLNRNNNLNNKFEHFKLLLNRIDKLNHIKL